MPTATKSKPSCEEVLAAREAEYASQKSPSQVIAEAQSLRESALTEYRQLARRMAHDERIEASEIARLSAAAGEAVEQFDALVRRFRHRRTIRERLQKLEPVEREFESVRDEIQRHNRTLEDAVALHQQLTGPLQARRAGLLSEFAELKALPAELVHSCPFPELRVESKRLHAAGDALHRQMSKVRLDIDRLQSEKRQAENATQKASICRKIEQIEIHLAALGAEHAEVAEKIEANYQAIIAA